MAVVKEFPKWLVVAVGLLAAPAFATKASNTQVLTVNADGSQEPFHPSSFHELFKFLDADGSGTITLEELGKRFNQDGETAASLLENLVGMEQEALGLKSCLDANTEYAGNGANAYVLRFTTTKACNKLKKGDAAKAFKDSDGQLKALNALARLPSVAELGGLAKTKKSEKDDNIFTDECAHAPTGMNWGTCYFVAMKDAGVHTLEHCLSGKAKNVRGEGVTPDFKELYKAALDVLIKIFKKGWVHRDYQTKNIMFDSGCRKATVTVVDLDGMEPVSEIKPDDFWTPARYMAQDLALLFGGYQRGGWTPSNHLASNAGKALKDQAADVEKIFNAKVPDLFDGAITEDQVIEAAEKLSAAL